MPVRKIFSAEMLADGKLRYERGDLVEDIAADWKCHVHTVTRTAKRQGWVRNRTRPPQELPETRRLQRRVEVAAEGGGMAEPPVPIAPADVGTARAAPLPTLQDAGADDAPLPPLLAGAGIVPGMPLTPQAVEQVERAVLRQLAGLETMRAQLGATAQTPAEAHQTARALATLTQTLRALHDLRFPKTPDSGSDDDDDMPRDIDEFRDELARRIRLLVQSRAGAGLRQPGEAADGDALGA